MVADDVAEAVELLPPLADFLQLDGARNRAATRAAIAASAARHQAGDRDPEQGVGVHQAVVPPAPGMLVVESALEPAGSSTPNSCK